MLTIHKNGAISMSAWSRDAVEVRWQTLECCQVCVILTSPLTVSLLKICVWESERQRVECTCSCKYLHRESKSRATVMSQYKCWAKIRHNLWTVFQNLYCVKYIWNTISAGCTKCGPWSFNVSLPSYDIQKKASIFFRTFANF